MSQKIAVVGSGISGLTSAYILSRHYEVHLFEANDTLGGHTHTVSVSSDKQTVNIDCGFIVFNKKTYPNFTQMLDQEKIAYEKSEMSFSFYAPKRDFYYNGNSLTSLFSDVRNLYKPPFYRMLLDIISFNITSKKMLSADSIQEITLKNFLENKKYRALFINSYLVPMISAIWSCPKEKALEMPLSFLLNFYENHGLLNLINRPQWYVIKNGSSQYISSLISRFKDNVHLSNKVTNIRRKDNFVEIYVDGSSHRFDKVVIATHSDEALQLLENPSKAESDILGAIKYENNKIILHTDTSVMPPNRKAWASWNYYENESGACTLNYYANRLQNLNVPQDFIVSVNLQDHIAQDKILVKRNFSHPILNQNAVDAQKQFSTINGINNTYFCGAYWGNGFHEDGVNSAQSVCNAIRNSK